MISEEVSWRKGAANSNKRINRISGRALKKRIVMGGRYFQVIVVFMKVYRKQENRRPALEWMDFACCGGEGMVRETTRGGKLGALNSP